MSKEIADMCIVEKADSNILVQENKRKALFKNRSRSPFRIITVDGCLIKDGMRSDYIVSEIGSSSVVIELKGCDVAHACDQLFATVENDKVNHLLEGSVGFLVICSKYPRFDSFVAKAKQKAAKKYKAGFHVVCNKGEFDISRVVAIDGPF